MHTVTVKVEESGEGLYTQTVQAGAHALVADEPVDVGGLDKGPAPYDLLLSALGACTAMTLRMYANQKKWDLKKATVKLTHEKREDAEKKKYDFITREIAVEGALDDAQRQRLLEIANKCPVHKTLTGEMRPVVESSLAE